ncbi:MAG: hypothetical protein LC632_00650 [Xanthomonadaceae bacterium]|nr:hypothetical protein [Xanthomonadaceae bacterium]
MRYVLVLIVLAALAPNAVGQEAQLRSYTPEDFARSAPRTALDMLRLVPGFVIRGANQVRGLGQASGNVLMNGARVSGKGNNVLDELGRIPVGNVVRIDLVDAATLDVPGLSGQVANVVVQSDAISGRWLYRPEFRRYYTDPVLTRGELSLTGAQGALEYSAGLANGAGNGGAGGLTNIFAPDGTLREQRDDVWVSTFDGPRLNARATYAHTGGAASSVNASYQRTYYDYDEHGLRTGPGLSERTREVTVRERTANHELAADHAFDLFGGRLKLIGLDRAERGPQRQTVLTRVTDGSAPDVASLYRLAFDERERIGRAEYLWSTGRTDWQVSAEGAFNRLDADAELSVLDAGVFVPIPLPGAEVTVTEDRYELMGSAGRPLTDTLTLQLSGGVERSRLQQVGTEGRTFVRPKGAATLAWSASADLEVNARIERRIGQLNFFDFVATVNLTDDRANAGNPDLVPPQAWELELSTTRQIGEHGNTTLRVYYHRIDDIVDIVPIGANGESPGNLDRATRVGAEWKATAELAALGWQGARLDVRWWLQHTGVRDPLTNEAVVGNGVHRAQGHRRTHAARKPP